MESFSYRAFLQVHHLLHTPTSPDNPLTPLWGQFRTWRDTRAWKSLTDRLRDYAKDHHRTLFISANGIARYVDLQVVGIWGNWRTQEGRVDLSESQLPVWRSLVRRGRALAGKRVPVVLFHDWGFGDPPFPFLSVPPSQRELWIRIRGAEIYAAGAFFAFPVLGPFGCDASRDGTLPVIARQTAFYQRHRDLFLRGRYVGAQSLTSETANLTLACWWLSEPPTLVVHVVNRNVVENRVQRKGPVVIRVPVTSAPETAFAVSPDWDGQQTLTTRMTKDHLEVTIPALDAYAIALLRYSHAVELHQLEDPLRTLPTASWSRPTRNEFRVRPDGSVQNEAELNAFLQGKLHTHLRNPPTFLVCAKVPGKLLVTVRAVAATGARLQCLVDGKPTKTVDLPDLDGKNDGAAPEYNKVLVFPLPAGDHRVSLVNVGPDWLTVSAYEFQGTFSVPSGK